MGFTPLEREQGAAAHFRPLFILLDTQTVSHNLGWRRLYSERPLQDLLEL